MADIIERITNRVKTLDVSCKNTTDEELAEFIHGYFFHLDKSTPDVTMGYIKSFADLKKLSMDDIIHLGDKLNLPRHHTK